MKTKTFSVEVTLKEAKALHEVLPYIWSILGPDDKWMHKPLQMFHCRLQKATKVSSLKLS